MNACERRKRLGVIDTMLSAHSALRDRYQRRARGLILLIMSASIVTILLALVVDSDRIEIAGIETAESTWLAILSALIFALAILELVVDWSERAFSHGDAARRLAELKARFRRVHGDDPSVERVDLQRLYDETTATITEIPERDFNRLKAKHWRKVAVGKLLDERPGAPLLYLRWLVFREGLR